MAGASQSMHEGNALVRIAERRAAVYELRRDGLTQAQIAARFGVDQATISRDLAAALKDRVEAPREAYIAYEIDRLEDQRKVVTDLLHTSGDDGIRLRASGELIKIAERMARLKGLDAPTQTQTEVSVLYEIVRVAPE